MIRQDSSVILAPMMALRSVLLVALPALTSANQVDVLFPHYTPPVCQPGPLTATFGLSLHKTQFLRSSDDPCALVGVWQAECASGCAPWTEMDKPEIWADGSALLAFWRDSPTYAARAVPAPAVPGHQLLLSSVPSRHARECLAGLERWVLKMHVPVSPRGLRSAVPAGASNVCAMPGAVVGPAIGPPGAFRDSSRPSWVGLRVWWGQQWAWR